MQKFTSSHSFADLWIFLYYHTPEILNSIWQRSLCANEFNIFANLYIWSMIVIIIWHYLLYCFFNFDSVEFELIPIIYFLSAPRDMIFVKKEKWNDLLPLGVSLRTTLVLSSSFISSYLKFFELMIFLSFLCNPILKENLIPFEILEMRFTDFCRNFCQLPMRPFYRMGYTFLRQ